MLSNKAYDVVKWVALILLDAVGVLYKTLSGIWGLPLGEEVLLTCSAVSVFLGALIGVSTAEYNKVKKAEEKKMNDPEEDDGK